jgi:serine/alanine racemase
MVSKNNYGAIEIVHRFTLRIVWLYLIGLLGDSYFGLTEQNVVLNSIYIQLFTLFDYTRNGIFFAPVFLALGAWKAKQSGTIKSAKVSAICFVISLGMMFLEGILLQEFKLPRHDSMYVFLVPAVYYLFHLLLLQRGRGGPYLRQLSTWMYNPASYFNRMGTWCG